MSHQPDSSQPRNLDQARALLRAERRDRELLERILRFRELEPLLDLLAEQLLETDDFAGHLIALADEAGEQLVCEQVRLAGQHQVLGETYRRHAFPVAGEDLNAVAYRQGQTLCLDRQAAEQYPSSISSRFELMEASCVAIVPLRVDGTPFGTVAVYKQSGRMSPEVLQRLEHLLEYFAPQLALLREREQLERRRQEVALAERSHQEFLGFVARINRLSTTDEIYQAIGTEFLRRFAFDLCGIALRQGEELVVQHVALREPARQGELAALIQFYYDTRYPLDASGGGLATVFQQDSPLLFHDLEQLRGVPMVAVDRRATELMGRPRTVLMLPVRRQSEPLGVQWLVSLDEPVELAAEEQKLVELLADFVGTAVGNAQLYDLVAKQNQAIDELNRNLRDKLGALEEEVHVDHLTGLFNFGYFEGELRRRTEEYDRRGPSQDLSLALFDVDYFKRFNDTYGHPAGNDVLQEVARRIRAVAREMDVPCRYGGEEFAVILPKCDLDGARQFAERARQEVAGTPFYVDGQYLPLTVSVGCATYAPPEQPVEFLKRADEALYRAKEAGRNRVEMTA